MTDRTVSVRLLANVAGYYAGIKTADKATKDFADTLEKSAAKRDSLQKLGNIAGGVGLAAAAGLGFAVKASADFDSAMSGVEAATHASKNTMDQLRAAAMQAGADTAFSATEAADGITQLSKAGVSSRDVLGGGLRGALSLAAAGELEVGEAAEIAATAMNQFGLSGKDVPHIADLLAAAAGKAQGEVTDVAQALKYVGPVAHQMGVSIEETVGVIGELASKGILADQAGTSMRGMLTALTSPSKTAAEEMDKLGISMYDAQGQFVGFDGVAQQLKTRMGDLSNAERDQALGRIFGNEQITAARILYAGGAKDVDKWTRSVNDQGFAAETAATKMDNLKGDLEELKGSLETALIGVGSGATQGPLRGMTQGLTDAINKFNELPQAAKDATFAFGALVAVTGGGAFLGTRFLIAVAEARAALTTLGISAAGARTALLGIGKGLTLAGVLYGMYKLDDAVNAIFHTDLDQSGLQKDLINLGETGKVSGSLLQTFGGDLNRFASDVDKLEGGLVSTKYGFQGLTDAAVGWLPGTTGFEATENRINGLDKALAQLVRSGNGDAAKATFEQLAAAAAKEGVSVQTLLKWLPAYRQALDNAAGGGKAAGDGQRNFAQGAGAATDAANGQSQAVKDLAASFETLNTKLEHRSDARAYEASLDAADDRLREHRDAVAAVADGEDALADARASAADQVEAAEDSLAAAQDQARQAQEDLNQAREDGAERLRDMRLELEGAALSEEGAQLSLLRAQQQLQETRSDPKSTGLDVAEADLAVREARLRIKEVRESNADLRKEYKDQSRHGVESTDEVVSAKEGVRDANKGVKDAEEGLADAMASSAESIAEAAKALKGLRRDLRLLAYGFNISNEAGRGNQEVLDNIVAGTLKMAEGMTNVKKRTAFLKQARGDFVAYATALGMPIKKARRLADELLRLPKNPIDVDVNVHTTAAERELRRLSRKRRIHFAVEVDKMPGDRTAPGLQPGTNYTETHAGGGWISGPLGIAGRGEFVVNREDARANRAVLEAINSGRRWADAPRQAATVSRTTSHHRDGDVHHWSVTGPSFAEIERQATKKKRHTNSGGKTFS